MAKLITIPGLKPKRPTRREVIDRRFSLPLETKRNIPPVSRHLRPLDHLDAGVPRNPEARRLHVSQEDTMASIINLPSRQGSIEYDEEQVQEIADLIAEAGVGQGVAVEDDPQDTEPKARNRAKIMRDLLERDHDLKTRTHAVEVDGGYLPALSLKKS
jgi:hypothetical protein